MSESIVDENAREWSDSARLWENYAANLRAMFSPVAAALIEEAGVVTGQRVLDVAGGAGEPSLTLAEVVGHSGSVTYTDLVAGMVRAAEREARRREIANIRFCQCPADSL